MTLHDCQRLFNHWKRQPPLRELVRACAVALGIEFPDPDAKSKHLTADEAMAMMRATDGRIPGVGGAF